MSAKHRKAVAALKAKFGSQVSEVRETRYATHTTIAGSSITETRTALQPIPQPVLSSLAPPTPEIQSAEQEETLPPKKRTQVSEQLDLFLKNESRLLDLLFERHADPHIGTPCSCSTPDQPRSKTTRCYDCKFGPTCSECFISAHISAPTHWAEVWDDECGFFIRHDISALRTEGYTIDLGHPGSHCPALPAEDSGVLFHLIDTNGIHQTRVRFCHCNWGTVDRVEQLMRHRFFPATMTRPTMAFSWQLCHYVHLLQAESKSALYDVVGTLRRLTNNTFSHDVPDPSSQLRVVMRVWRKITATKRLGQAHGIDALLPNRTAGNIIVHCPSCLELGVNMEDGWERTPEHLKHLQQTQHTLDGNHHLNKYVKNTDPDDVSLFRGRSFFPDDVAFRHYLKSIPNNALEKTTCLNLNVLNSQDRKKFKNMDVTGVVQVQCSHVFVKSTVDLQLGERFANADYALAHALQQNVPPSLLPESDHIIPGFDHLISYDISCAYSVHIVKRFKEHFPKLANAVSKFRWLIPLVHVNNHKENCDYLFSSAYTPNANHFHGETAEHVWPNSNLVGPQTRQMNNGHRHDTIIDHNNDWNYKKMVNLATTLFNEIMDAKRLFVIKREAFTNLSQVNVRSIPEWNKLDRSAQTLSSDGQVISVYRQKQAKVPSQARIHQMLLEELSTASGTPSTAVKGAGLPSFINDGVSLLLDQWKIKAKATMLLKGEVVATKPDSLDKERTRLQGRIDQWRKDQKTQMPQLGDHVEKARLDSTNPAEQPECIKLFLPSDLSLSERSTLDLTSAAESQRKLLEGAAFDVLHRLRTIVKGLNIGRQDKSKNARGQVANTRATTKIKEIELQRDLAISEYNNIRQALFKLGVPLDDPNFPPLSAKDTEMKRTDIRRQPGDTHRTDGLLWTNTGVTLGSHLSSVATTHPDSMAAGSSRAALGAQGSRAKKRTKATIKGAPRGTKRRDRRLENAKDAERVARKRKPMYDAWLWKLAPGRLTQPELVEWSQDSDRVQWFRAEAEMQRWQEQVEKKQADFLHAIRYFEKLSDVWSILALSTPNTHPGRTAYARRTSANFSAMAVTARALFKQAGYEDRLPCEGKILADFIQADREQSPDIISETTKASQNNLGDSSDSDSSMELD